MGLATVARVCGDCGKVFEWTPLEQDYAAMNGFTYPPKRCKPCRANRRVYRDARVSASSGVTQGQEG